MTCVCVPRSFRSKSECKEKCSHIWCFSSSLNFFCSYIFAFRSFSGLQSLELWWVKTSCLICTIHSNINSNENIKRLGQSKSKASKMLYNGYSGGQTCRSLGSRITDSLMTKRTNISSFYCNMEAPESWRALASHQCGPGSIPGLGVICGLSLLLVLVLAPRVFSGYSYFPPFLKTNISKFQFHLEFVERLNMSLWLGRLGNHSLRFRRKIKYLVFKGALSHRCCCVLVKIH